MTPVPAELQEQIKEDLQPYVDLMAKGIGRTTKLIDVSKSASPGTSDDILRAVVVLTHAYVEDLLRTVASVFLPAAGEVALDVVPLAGLGDRGRAEKFALGKLARHRGKTVDNLIRESVSEYLDGVSFNNVTEMISFIKGLGLSLPEKKEEWEADFGLEWGDLVTDKRPTLTLLDEMIRRRHHIVHQTDKSKSGDGLMPINAKEVLSWLMASTRFMGTISKAVLEKKYIKEK